MNHKDTVEEARELFSTPVEKVESVPEIKEPPESTVEVEEETATSTTVREFKEGDDPTIRLTGVPEGAGVYLATYDGGGDDAQPIFQGRVYGGKIDVFCAEKKEVLVRVRKKDIKPFETTRFHDPVKGTPIIVEAVEDPFITGEDSEEMPPSKVTIEEEGKPTLTGKLARFARSWGKSDD